MLQIVSGKQLRINFKAKVSYLRKYKSIYLDFSPSRQTYMVRLFKLYTGQYYNYSYSKDDRGLFEWEENQSFLLLDTTLSDSGAYSLHVNTYYLSTTFDVHVIVSGRLTN